MPILSIFDQNLPITDPVLRLLIVLAIMLAAPLLLNKLKVPQLLGLIVAGAIIGPHGFNIVARDSSIVVTGTTGLLYIMFLAGLEIDLADFKRNSKKSLVFGIFTFAIPMLLGIIAGKYVLNFSWMTSVLLASMFASHTLIAYPIVSKMGVTKNQAVNVTVGGTMITDTLALLVLAVIVGMTRGQVDTMFWVNLIISIAVFGAFVMLVFPIIGRWFFKKVDDKISQYIFVLVMMYFGAILAEVAGIEAIIGAFLAGLALNRLIPHTSTLMNRVEFVGNAYFIPFFLISVGMLIDYTAFFKDLETIKVAIVMTVIALAAKYAAAAATQKTYGYSKDQRGLIFGLSSAQAAATLAAVLVGYNIIIAETSTGEPVRLLNESILNGTILMILATCTVASFVSQKAAKNIALSDITTEEESDLSDLKEKILIAVNDQHTADDLVQLGLTIKSKTNKEGLYALNIIDDEKAENKKQSKVLMEMVTSVASSADATITTMSRYYQKVASGITSVVKENNITDVVLGLTVEKGISSSFLSNLTQNILKSLDTTMLIYKPAQPLATIKKHIILVPHHAEKEPGFPYWLLKVWNIARNTGAHLIFYGSYETNTFISKINEQHPVPCEFKNFDNWDDFLIISRELLPNDNLIVVLSRTEGLSYQSAMKKIPGYLNKYFTKTSYIIVYPEQPYANNFNGANEFTNSSMIGSLQRLDEIGQSIRKLFKSN